MDAIVDLAKVLLPAGLFLYGMYMLVRSFINRDIDVRKLEVRNRAKARVERLLEKEKEQERGKTS